MSARIPYLEPDDADGSVAEIYRTVQNKFGDVLNIVKVLGNSSAGLSGVMSAMGALEEFDLDPVYVELAYLKVSDINDCEY